MKTRNAIAGIFLSFIFLLHSSISKAQSPGIVVRPAGGPYSTILDPDQNGFTSSSTSGFATSDIGAGYSEIPYKVVPPAIIEPTGDVATGPNGGFTDIVKTVDGSGFYIYYNGSNLLFRLRIGNIISGSKGYSILFDTDGKIGNSGPDADPNFIAPTNTSNGNPGFEYEVVLRTNFDIAVYNVDGTKNPVLLTTYPLSTNSLISTALSTDSDNPDYFYDFTVPVSALGSPSSFRIATTTVTSPTSALQGSRSDIYGIDDSANPNVSSTWQTVVKSQPTINLTDISAGGSGIGATCTAAPSINSGITSGSNIAVSGSWTRLDASKPSSATITLYKNGVASGTTTVSTGNTWTITVASIANGDVFYAKAQAAGESMCLQSSSVTAGCNTPPASPVLTCASSKGISGNIPAGSTILIYLMPTTAASPTSNPLTTNITYPVPGSFAFYVNGCSGGTNNVVNGTYMLMSSNGGCLSAPVFECISSSSSSLVGLTVNPSISVTTPIYPYQTSISGSGAVSGNILHLFINGQYKSTITATGSAFSFPGLSLKASDQIKIYVYAGSTCMTVSNSFAVSCYSQPPLISTDANGNLSSTATSVSGTSVYSGASVILYKGIAPGGIAVGSPATTSASGSWTVSGLALTAGDSYYATITADGCTSQGSSSASVLAATTACASITGSYTESSTSISGTLASSFTGTVRLYLDGTLIGSSSVTAATAWSVNSPFTYSLYPGAVLTTSTQASGGTENFNCSSSATIGCTAPSTPTVTPLVSVIPVGTTVTFNVSNVTANSWYALLDNNGNSYATSVYKTNTGTFNLTSNPFVTAGTFNLKLSANKLNGCTLSYQAAMVTASTTLPITLLDFNAVYLNESVYVEWSTANEMNVSRFEIEKGTDGITFSPIGSVNAKGTNQLITNYKFTDPKPGINNMYYRLKSIDLDGKSSFSKVVGLNIKPAQISSISPNPFNQELFFTLSLDQKQPLIIEIRDVSGRTVRRISADGQKGYNRIHLSNLSNLPNGLYVIGVDTGNQLIQQKIIKYAGK